MKRASASGMGPKCERRELGSKARTASPKRRKRKVSAEAPATDPRQLDFFSEDLQFAQRVDALLSTISLEVSHA